LRGKDWAQRLRDPNEKDWEKRPQRGLRGKDWEERPQRGPSERDWEERPRGPSERDWEKRPCEAQRHEVLFSEGYPDRHERAKQPIVWE